MRLLSAIKKTCILLFLFTTITLLNSGFLYPKLDSYVLATTRLTLDWDIIDYPQGTTSGESYVVTNPYTGPDVRVNIDFSGDLTQLTNYPDVAGTITPNETGSFSSAGGVGGGGNSLVVAMDPPSGSSSITTTISFNFLQENIEFSIYDIDNFYSGNTNTSRRDSVRVIGYAGSLEVKPNVSLANPTSATLTVVTSGNYGIGASKALPPTSASNNDTKGTMDVIFNEPIDRIEIEYLEANSTGSNPGFRWITISDIHFDAPFAPQTVCSTSAATLDWASVSYTSGSLNESITITNPGSGPDVTFNFELTDNTGHLVNTTPVIDAAFASMGGGEGSGGSVLRIDADAPLGTSSKITTSITMSNLLRDVRFSIYDIDSSYTGAASNAGIDSIKVLGYSGTTPIVPIIITPNSDPSFTSSYNDVYGVVKGFPFNPSGTGPSNNDTKGTLDVYFELPVNKIVIEYYEANTNGSANPAERSIGVSKISFCPPVNEPVTCSTSLSELDWGSIDYSAGALTGQSFDVVNPNLGSSDMTIGFSLLGDTGHLVASQPDDNTVVSNGGGEGGGGESLEIQVDPPGSATSSNITTSISLNNLATDVRFTIYDIDNSMSAAVQDSVRIIGYNGSDPVAPILIPVNSSPTFTIDMDENYGVAVASDPSSDDQSTNDTKGSLDVYFVNTINRIEIEYIEANTAPSDFGNRSISISDISFCSNNAEVIQCLYPLEFLDWGSISYTAGATSGEEFTIQNPASGGDVVFSFDFTGNLGDFKDGTPLVNSDMNSAGGVGNGTESLYMLIDGGTTSKVTLTINISQTLSDVRFSIFDIDNGLFGTGNANSRQDSVRIIGFNGNTEVPPTIIAVDNSPTFSISSSGNYGIATASDFPPEASSSNDTKGTADVFFSSDVNQIQIEYIEGNVHGNNPVQRAIYLSDIYFCPNQGVLPVEFLDFTVQQKQQEVLIDWSTASEINNSYFSVQRSLNAQTWETIGTVESRGNSSAVEYYTHIDKPSQSGRLFYRIKQTDISGNYSYSEIRSIENKVQVTHGHISITPNPSSDLINLSYMSSPETYSYVDILDNSGQVVYSNPRVKPGLAINISNLKPGIYILRLTQQEGTSTTRFIVK